MSIYTGKLLLVGCSNNKNRFYESLPARKMYGGTLTLGGIRFAEENGMECLILSAKYGFISPDTVIERYDARFTKKNPYSGEWPIKEGFYLGGPDYFRNAPPRFQSLLPEGLQIGLMVKELKKQLIDPNLEYTPRKQKTHGKTWYLYQWLLEAGENGKGITKDECYVRLCNIFGEDYRMKQTIDTQFRQGRIGDERGCVFHNSGGNYFLVPKPGIKLL